MFRSQRRIASPIWVCGLTALATAADWRPAPSSELMLPNSVDCWEPSLAVAAGGEVFVVAGRRDGQPGSASFEQRLVIWRSDNQGRTFAGPRPVSVEGHFHFDQRIATDADGTIYISYMDQDALGPGRPKRLRLARSLDGGGTFSVQTITDERVTDKPELAVSRDGRHLYIVYDSAPGPRIVASHDAGRTWERSRVIRQRDGYDYWPMALAVAPDGSIWFAVPSMSALDTAHRRTTPVQLHVFRSRDGGITWEDYDMGSSPRFVRNCAHDPNCRVKLPGLSLAVDGRNRTFVAYLEGSGPHQPYGLYMRSTSDGGRTWLPPQAVSEAQRPSSLDTADHDFPMVAASASDQVCIVWVDDRRGALDVWARCSIDGGHTFGSDVLLSNRGDGAGYKSSSGFRAFYGHYGGAGIGSARLYAVWGAGEPDYRTGGLWFNRVDLSYAVRR